MLTLIVARLHEDLGWLHRLPAHCRVRVHNHGPAIDPANLPDGVQVTVMATPPSGGQSISVLQHLRQGRVAEDARSDPEGHTLFITGQPFAQAPALLGLMADAHRWGDVQVLSGRREVATAVDRRDWIGSLPVQAVHFSLSTWAPLDRDDPVARRHAQQARLALGVGEGSNLSAAFYMVCGLPDLAADAAQADLGVMAAGGLFAVRNRILGEAHARLANRLDTLWTLCMADPHYGWVLERAWLHLVGLPHMRLAALPRPTEAAQATHGSLARVVASIDALLARAETRSSKPARARIEAPAALTPRAEVWTPELRARTQAALAQGDPDGAMAMLTQAGQREPASAEALAQAAAQALRLGELGHAVPLARRALLHDPAHAGARQTLAQGLAAQHAATGTIPAATTDASTHASATATATRSAAAQRPWGALN